MSSVVQKPKLLIVDTSPSMAQVLTTYAMFEEYPLDTICDPADACVALNNNHTYQCVVLGWPEGKINIVADLLKELSEPAHVKLPLIVISQKSSAMIEALSTRRPDTRALLWKDYRELGRFVEELVVSDAVEPISVAPAARQILIVSDNPSQNHELVDLLIMGNHQVSFARTAAQAKTVLKSLPVDFVISDFYLRDESAENLCQQVNQMDVAPVVAVMTDRNLDEVVQRSLRAGAITCINKAEPIDSLFPRLDAIIKGLSSSVAFDNVDRTQGKDEPVQEIAESLPVKIEPVVKRADPVAVGAATVQEPVDRLADTVELKTETVDPVSSSIEREVVSINQSDISIVPDRPFGDQVLVPLNGLLELSDQPAILLDNKQRIVAASQKAQEVLSPDAPEKLLDNASLISLTGLDLTSNTGSGWFSTAAGEEIEIEFQNKKLLGESNGVIEDYDHLTFEVLKDIPEPQTSVAVEHSVSTEERVTKPTLQQTVATALLSSQVVSILVVDIKMIAAVTGDRLSLGMSEPMLGMVKEELAEQYPRENALTYLGDGRFALLFETQRVEQALNLSKKLVNSIPALITELGDIELVSHGAFLRIPDHSSMPLDYLLKHCAAACLKTELDGRDNSIYVIGKEPWQRKTGRSVSERSVSERLPVVSPGRPAAVQSRDLGVSLAG